MSVVLVDNPSPHVRRLLINRPDKRNAIDYAVRQEMTEALLALQGDNTVRALVLGGVDGVFSAGGDVPSMAGLDEAGARARMQHIHRLCRLVADARVPVVSAVEGFCAGAAVGLALLGDHILVGKSTRILFPFMRLGLVPDWGTLRSLPARVGVATARRIMTNGQSIQAREALRIGLADSDAGEGNVMAAALRQAEAMAQLPGVAFYHLKQRLMHPSGTLEQEWQREEDDQAQLLLGPDFEEGFAAFNGKRDPHFGGGGRD
ncbi:enoyl-CoA hydratase/isomerase family protein [Haliea sp. E1-2-M8]|uniref:enoyl-CoA hydratase/isomerase family protein n=1 Tax=Haliea sp. E1-2-M8 TaxID=3064706 RepID=UPI00271DA00A|nr:enoyl-CoA hydratase/isomerase family protein [Haliea sp. E1-2-M8]MDO8864102.1 enoyl-CoA hydratase/isomerase family protein [Haliea sp. E1-2-M8]